VRLLRRGLLLIVLLVAALAAGTVVHELIGHGLTTIALGGKVTHVVILGVQFYPSIAFVNWPIVDGYGYIDTEGLAAGPRQHLARLAGSMSTWLVAVMASLLLWTRRRWFGWPKAVLIVLSLFWIDLLTYTLPSWGIPRSILWGQNTVSEPYEAAVALGIDGNAFRVLVFLSCGVMLTALLVHIFRARRYPPDEPTGKPAE
jgi:hypothetical protein